MRNSWGTLCGCTWASWERSLEKQPHWTMTKHSCGLQFDQMGTSKNKHFMPMNWLKYADETPKKKKNTFFLSFCYTYNIQHRLLFDLLIWNNLFYSIGTHKCTVEDNFFWFQEKKHLLISHADRKKKKRETRPINSEWKQQVCDVKFWWGNARWALALSIQINLRYTNITKKQQEYDRIKKRYKWNNKRLKHANQTDQ